MNIFEALEKGEGRATLPNVSKSKFAIKKLVWIIDISATKGNSWDIILEEDLKRNDWIPYVPPEQGSTNEETSKTTDPWTVYDWLVNELRMQGFKEDLISKMLVKPDVPRGTCSNCGVPSIFGSGRMVKLTP